MHKDAAPFHPVSFAKLKLSACCQYSCSRARSQSVHGLNVEFQTNIRSFQHILDALLLPCLSELQLLSAGTKIFFRDLPFSALAGRSVGKDGGVPKQKDKVPPPQTSTAFFSTNDASLDRCVVAHCHRESSLASPREPIGIFSSQMGEGWRSLEVSKTLFSNQEVCFHQESCRAYLFTAPASARIKILFRVALSRGSGPVLGMAGLSVAWGLMEVAGAELCT